MTLGETKEFIEELIQHLDFTGWGDSYERDVSTELREKAWKWIEDNT